MQLPVVPAMSAAYAVRLGTHTRHILSTGFVTLQFVCTYVYTN